MKKIYYFFPILLNVVTVSATPRDNGFYVGLSTSCCSSATNYIETTATINANGKHLNEKKRLHSDSSIWPLELKVGYKHLNNNRFEIFRRNTDIDLKYGDEGTITSKTIGVNYEWGLNSIASLNKKILPFISLGYGWGSATSSSKHIKLKKSDSKELDFALGVHYQLSKHFDTTLGVYHRKILLLEKDNARRSISDVFTDGEVTATSINAGISYHF